MDPIKIKEDAAKHSLVVAPGNLPHTPANNGFADGYCRDPHWYSLIRTVKPALAQTLNWVPVKNTNTRKWVFVKAPSNFNIVTGTGDACHGGLSPEEMTKCEMPGPAADFGLLRVCSATFDESKLDEGRDDCSRAILAFKNGNVLPSGAPAWLFDANDSNIDNARRFLLWKTAIKMTELENKMVNSGGGAAAPVSNDFYKEPLGFMNLISNDAALYSCVDARSTIVAAGGCIDCDRIKLLKNMQRCMAAYAQQYNFETEWIGVTHGLAFDEFADKFSCCRYGGCGGVQMDAIVRDSLYQQQLNGRYLDFRGQTVPFLLDNTVKYVAGPNPGTMKTDILFVPRRVNGEDAMYVEYFQYAEPTGTRPTYQTFANGRYKVTTTTVGACISICVEQKFRPQFMYPWLAAKMTDVCFDDPGCAL